MPKLIDLTGKKFSRLTVIALHGIINKRTLWKCRCDCGNTKIIAGYSLLCQDTRSCGCIRRGLGNANAKHGEAKKTKEYNAWASLIQRCYDKKGKRYHRYGGRGIKVCDRWLHSYENFLADMGRAPSPLYSLDRKENDGDYEPDNCKWATATEQANNQTRNRKIQYNSRTQTLSQWCDELGLSYPTIYKRITSYGWPIDLALSSPVKSYKLK